LFLFVKKLVLDFLVRFFKGCLVLRSTNGKLCRAIQTTTSADKVKVSASVNNNGDDNYQNSQTTL